MSAKRNLWATIGKILWAVLSLFFRIAAKLGSRWAGKKLDRHDARNSGRVRRLPHRRDHH